MSADVYLDPMTGDLPPAFRYASDTELVLQRSRIRLESFLGEWLLDQTKGLPYLDWRKVKQPPLDEIVNLVRREISTVPGVLRTSDPSGSVDGEVISVSMTVAIPEADSFRVRIDLFGTGLGSTETDGYSAVNLTGSDPVQSNASPFCVINLIAGTLD